MSSDTFRIGHLSTFYHTAYILMGTDLLSQRGISAEWELFPSGPDIINAMKKGAVDLAYIGLPPVIIGIDKGLPLVCIAGGHIEGTIMIGSRHIRPLDSFPGIKSFIQQFEGKAIGSPPKGSIHDIIIRDLIAGDYPGSIEVINYPWADFIPDALERGEISAAVGTPALAVAAEWYGNSHLLIKPTEIWPYNPSYGIITTREGLSEPGPLIGFLTAHEQACEMIRHNPEECAKIITNVTGIVEEAFLMDVFQVSPHYCAALPERYIRSTMEFVHTLYHLGITTRERERHEVFDTSLISLVHPGPDHYREGILK